MRELSIEEMKYVFGGSDSESPPDDSDDPNKKDQEVIFWQMEGGTGGGLTYGGHAGGGANGQSQNTWAFAGGNISYGGSTLSGRYSTQNSSSVFNFSQQVGSNHSFTAGYDSGSGYSVGYTFSAPMP